MKGHFSLVVPDNLSMYCIAIARRKRKHSQNVCFVDGDINPSGSWLLNVACGDDLSSGKRTIVTVSNEDRFLEPASVIELGPKNIRQTLTIQPYQEAFCYSIQFNLTALDNSHIFSFNYLLV